MPATVDSVWQQQDTTPAEVEEALRRLERERHEQDPSSMHARVLNLVLVVDRDWSGEIANRLRRVGRFHPSRTIVCAVDPGRTTIDALVTVAAPGTPGRDGTSAPARELVVLDIGPRHLDGLDTLVDPLVKTDLPVLVWAPHGHHDAVADLLGLAHVVLVDSVADPDPSAALGRALELADRIYVVDLAWLRSTPWRERIAGTFDPPSRRCELPALTGLEIRHHPDSAAAALLLAGWLGSRLGWEPAPLGHDGPLRRCGTVRAGDRDVTVELVADRGQDVPGLAGITVRCAGGEALALDRGRGGLRATQRRPDGTEHEWTLLGASRGEAGVLGEGIRQALLRDPTYLPALRVARRLAAA